MGTHTPPFPSEFPSWSETWAGGRRQSLGGIWGEGTPPCRPWEPPEIISPAIKVISTRTPRFHYKRLRLGFFSPIRFL